VATMEQIENRIDRQRAKIIGAITAVHFLLSVVFFFLWAASSNLRFDGEGPSDLTHLLLGSAFQILSFPLLTTFLLLKIANTGMWGWLVFLGNSALWGWAGWKALRFWRSRRGGSLAIE
jgi:hypothetical protein